MPAQLTGGHQLNIWAGFFEAGLSVKFELRYEDLKSKFISIQFSLPTIWWLDTLKRKKKIFRESAFDKKIKNPGFPGLVITCVQTTGPRYFVKVITQHTMSDYKCFKLASLEVFVNLTKQLTVWGIHLCFSSNIQNFPSTWVHLVHILPKKKN